MKFKCSVLFAFLVGQVICEPCENKCIPKGDCTAFGSVKCIPCGEGCVSKKNIDACDSDDLCNSENGKCVTEADCKPGKKFECKKTTASGAKLCNANGCTNVCRKKKPKKCPKAKKGGEKCIPKKDCDEEEFDCIPCKGKGKKKV